MSDYIQIVCNRGHSNIKDKSMHKNDFYTILMKDPKNNIGIRKKSESHHLPTFKSSEVTIDYLCSDFVRFCLSLYKSGCYIHRGELTIIPKQHISISDELKEYIEQFLPDYYGIRK